MLATFSEIMTTLSDSGLFYFYLVSMVATSCSFAVLIIIARDLYSREQRIPHAARYEHIESLLQEIEREYEARRDEVAKARAIIEDKEAAQEWLNLHKDDVDRLKSELEQLYKKEAELLELLRNVAEKTEELRKLETECNAAKFNLEKYQELEKRNMELEEKLGGIRSEIQNANAKLSTTQAELQRISSELKSKMEYLDESKQIIAQSEKTLDELKQQVREKQNEKYDLEGKINRLIMEQENEKGILEDIQKQNKRIGINAGNPEDSLRELWQPVFEKASNVESPPESEVEAIEKVKSHIQRSNYHFSDRVINAFHTSLKIADISPLVILAGISGTGKSQLPRLYCEAMGINFLNMATQPRWDSPQDMFGFYNYIENKYRATELARALLQMDQFWEVDGRGWQGCPENWKDNTLCEQMLLVLIDEMNLARVEYYFSEFLSRLEIRPNIRKNDSSDRVKAEIPLEIGLAAEDKTSSPIMRLFVDTNVLFVGTINEDESTQTLSDKVLDRANLLRFGKPKKLSEQLQVRTVDKAKHITTYEQWQSWIHSEEKVVDHRDQIDHWVNTLNSALSKIGRPFAYRTKASIYRYIANYPVDAIKKAMADQVEFKILPKLRGIDPLDANCLEAITQITEMVEQELGDSLLANAIKDRENEHQFTWSGVDRSDEN